MRVLCVETFVEMAPCRVFCSARQVGKHQRPRNLKAWWQAVAVKWYRKAAEQGHVKAMVSCPLTCLMLLAARKCLVTNSIVRMHTADVGLLFHA